MYLTHRKLYGPLPPSEDEFGHHAFGSYFPRQTVDYSIVWMATLHISKCWEH